MTQILKNRSWLAGGGNGGVLVDTPVHAINVLRVAANVADAETVTIGNDVYEFDRADNGVVASGAIAVTGHADDTPANATNALIAAINADGTEPVTAIDISANEILIVADRSGPVTLACSESLAGAGNAWAAAAMFGGRHAKAPAVLTRVKRVPLATEVTLGGMHFYFPFAPVLIAVSIITAAGAVLAWDGVATVTGNRLTLDNGGSVDWTATDTVTVLVTDA